MNVLKTAILLATLTAIFIGIGFLIGGKSGALIAFLMAAATNLIGYWNADRIVLRMHNAVEVNAQSRPEYYSIVQRLAERAGIPMPRVYLIQNAQPNAFATGRNPENAAVAATTGLLERLTPEEVTGVMAHELAHVRNRDTLIMSVTATLAGAISMLANFAFFFGGNRDGNNPYGAVGLLFAALTAPFAALLVQMAISRTREYSADRLGAEICGEPRWLASALAKIARAASRIPMASAERNPASAHLFIVNPLSGARMDDLFSTHPGTENRIAELNQLAREMSAGGRALANSPDAEMPGPWSHAKSSAAPVEEPRGLWSNAGRRAGTSPTKTMPRRGPWG